MADAQFIEQRQLSTQEIARLFRIPLHLIGAPLAHSLTYSNAEWESMEFLKFSIGPTLRLIESAITADPDLSPSTVFCEFDNDDLLRADSLTRSQVYTAALAGGWMTVDEIRQRERLPRLPGGGRRDPRSATPDHASAAHAATARRRTTPQEGTPMPTERPVPGQFEERAEPITVDGRRIRGVIPFGVESRDMGGWTEIIEPGALRGADLSELVATVEHRGLPIGRHPGTLALEERADGVHWSVDPPASRQDVVEAVERGDLRAGSWRMRVARDSWQGDVRHVHEIAALRDVAIVTSPAYPASMVELRSQPEEATVPTAEAAEATETETLPETPEEATEARVAPGSLRVEDRNAATPRRGLADEFRARGFPGEVASMPWEEYESRAVTWSASVDLLAAPVRREGVPFGFDVRYAWPRSQGSGSAPTSPASRSFSRPPGRSRPRRT